MKTISLNEKLAYKNMPEGYYRCRYKYVRKDDEMWWNYGDQKFESTKPDHPCHFIIRPCKQKRDKNMKLITKEAVEDRLSKHLGPPVQTPVINTRDTIEDYNARIRDERIEDPDSFPIIHQILLVLFIMISALLIITSMIHIKTMKIEKQLNTLIERSK